MGRTMVGAFIVLSLAYPASADDDPLKVDLAAIQGKWAVKLTDKDGEPVRAVKEIKGNRETYTLFKGEEIVLKREVDIKLSRADNKVRICTVTRVTSVKGPEEGRTFDVDQSYVYKTVGDFFIEVDSILIDKNFEGLPPQLVAWRRVKE